MSARRPLHLEWFASVPKSLRRALALTSLVCFAVACASGSSGAPPPARPSAPKPQNAATWLSPAPKSDGASGLVPAPGVRHSRDPLVVQVVELGNGLRVHGIERRGAPLLELRLIVRAGTVEDAARPGLALLAGKLLLEASAPLPRGAAARERIEALGGTLDGVVTSDRTILALSIESQHLDAALETLANIASSPAVSPARFRAIQRQVGILAAEREQTDPTFVAERMLYHELYESPTFRHPYGEHGGTRLELEALRLADYERWCGDWLTPASLELVIAGDIDVASLEPRVDRAFGRLSGQARDGRILREPLPRERREIFLVDRPGLPDALLYVGTFGPGRNDPNFAALEALVQALNLEFGQTLGAGVTSPRGDRAAAEKTQTRASAALGEVLHGPVPVMLHGRAPTEQAGELFKLIFGRYDSLALRPPETRDVTTALAWLHESQPQEVDSARTLANAAVDSVLLERGVARELEYRALRYRIAPADVQAAAQRYFAKRRGTAVAVGDATRIAPQLSRFGPVHIVDPNRNFLILRTVPHNPTQSLETVLQPEHTRVR